RIYVDRQHRQVAARRPEGDRAAGRRVERRVVARAHERRLRLVGLVERRPVELDRAARVRADPRVGDDPVRVVALQLCRQAELVDRQLDEDERGGHLLLARRADALGEGEVEVVLLDVRRLVGTAALVDEPLPLPPGRAQEVADAEERTEGDGRREDGEGERAARAEQAELEEAPARDPRAGLLDELGDHLLLVRVLVRRVLLRELLRRDELEPDDNEREGEEDEREPQRQAEELRRSRDVLRERVDEDEAERRQRREAEQREDAELGGEVRRLFLHEPLSAARAAAAAPEQEDEQRDDRVCEAPHGWNLLPITRQSASSAGIAMNHVTRPSVIGPR